MKKIAIIGASYLQEPLIQKAKSRGIETHVFAWACNDIGEKSADYFYPISIVEKGKILNKCREIGIDAVCSIASDLAVITVNYIAEELGLVGNSTACTKASTDKHLMRKCFEMHNDPSPRSIEITGTSNLSDLELFYPVIVKPVDRSGSRGITKVDDPEQIESAIDKALRQGFEKKAIIEEYVPGQEYSVECISWEGHHDFLALTKKYTTGAPNFIETAHLEPATISVKTLARIKNIVTHALDSLGIKYGASHSELKVADTGEIKIIEIGGRMGGDCIGSSLVELSTGYDYVGAVLDISLGIKPRYKKTNKSAAAVRFVFTQEDITVLNQIKQEHPELLVEEHVRELSDTTIADSSSRFGYYIITSKDSSVLEKYMPGK